jgi:hypothetical protein
MDRLDIGRILAIVAESVAQQSDRLEQRRFRDERAGPHGIHQRLFRDDHARRREQRRQHANGARWQRHGAAVAPQSVAGDEAKLSKTDGFRTSSGHLEDSIAGFCSF